MSDWYNAEHVSQPGSVVLARWMAQRTAERIERAARAERAARVQASGEMYPSSSGDSGSTLYDWMTGGMRAAGVVINERTAMCVSAVYACVSLIGGAIASLPLQVYERTPEGHKRVDHDIWWLLNEQPCQSMSAAVFREYLAASLLLQGDSFSEIVRPSRRSPRIDAFVPRHPLLVDVLLNDGRLAYRVHGERGEPEHTVDQDDMLHIPGPGFDGRRGLSQIRNALRLSAGIARAADQYSADFFANGMKPDYAIEVPGTPDKEQQDMIRRTWSERHGIATGHAHLPALLTDGMKVQELTMNAEDAQLIATRQFQVEDVARIFGVPPFMIGHTQNTTSWGSGVEQMGIGFVKYTLQRHLRKIEQELNRKVWSTEPRYFVEFNTAGLERGDYKSRNEGYRIALGRAGEPGWMAVNEVRRLENMPPVPGGDELDNGSGTGEKQAAAAAR